MRKILTSVAVAATVAMANFSATAEEKSKFRDLRNPFMDTVAEVNGMKCLLHGHLRSAWCPGFGKVLLDSCNYPAILDGRYVCLSSPFTASTPIR